MVAFPRREHRGFGEHPFLVSLGDLSAVYRILVNFPKLTIKCAQRKVLERWRETVVDRYRRQGQHCPLAVLMSEIGRTTPGAQAVTSALTDKWHEEIANGIRHMQSQSKVTGRIDADRLAAALLAGIQGGVGLLLATGDISYLEAALDVGIDSLRSSA